MTAPTAQSVSKPDLIKLYRQALTEGVALDAFEKKVAKLMERNNATVSVEQQEDKKRTSQLKAEVPLFVRVMSVIIPLSLVSTGLFLVGSAVVPIASSYVLSSQQFTNNTLAAPVPQAQVLDIVPTVVTEQTATARTNQAVFFEPEIIDTKLDYTNLANWFDAGITAGLAASETTYTIEIPSLKIDTADVKVGGTDLNQSLIQYPGTALPGEIGAPVIFGHSVLRQFYNPESKNSRRYVSIFSYIMTLKPGEDIFVTYQGVKYQYKVREKKEVKPTDTYILAQRNDSRLLKLVTCTPEGTYLRRGIITAELVN